MFSVRAIANATHAYLMKIAGQRIVARLRGQMYASALRQEVEFVKRGEGDVLSRLGSDSTIVGDSVNRLSKRACFGPYLGALYVLAVCSEDTFGS
ncbi:hypothetical protein EXIGLDRAFT_778839 [Exidia glandulosa HHB12029]|uniref:ABC transmembrane type-1 domain-containing protein n=1 Tax=Exidia glandulosa HHB12029 TaxID=1314781 RepID=A0A165CCH0_EXIGL|nr:hypothetical protein EXIGLDRAFT_778839 [Exidia glandulosa HHB12029]